MDKIEEYLKKSDANEERNEIFLQVFSDALHEAGLAEKTIRKHLNNAGFYLNVYLDRAGVIPMEEGASEYHLSDFMGYFFIRKCMWSTPASIRSTAASLKKFYKCMLQHNKITQEQYDELTDTIKYQIEDWQEDCARFNDPDAENLIKSW